jgi:hypothetical protein
LKANTDPQTVTFVHTTNPYNDSDTSNFFYPATESTEAEQRNDQSWNVTSDYPYPFMPSSTHGLEALSAAASGDHYLQDNTRRLEPADDFPPPLDPRLNIELSETCLNMFEPPTETVAHEFDPKLDQDVPFLLRYFSEGPGAWMDLFDLESFFAVDVPLKAAYSPLLLYASIALSAKALGRIRITAQHPKGSGAKRTPSDWSHKARFYYDQAITLLRQALENETRHVSLGRRSPQSLATSSDLVEGLEADRQLAFPTSGTRRGVRSADSDELIATTAILCVFEFLDASGMEWSRHLDGAKSLFDIAKDGTVHLSSVLSADQSPMTVPRPTTTTKGRRAVFWNICRQEMLNACELELIVRCCWTSVLTRRNSHKQHQHASGHDRFTHVAVCRIAHISVRLYTAIERYSSTRAYG